MGCMVGAYYPDSMGEHLVDNKCKFGSYMPTRKCTQPIYEQRIICYEYVIDYSTCS